MTFVAVVGHVNESALISRDSNRLATQSPPKAVRWLQALCERNSWYTRRFLRRKKLERRGGIDHRAGNPT
jgi:hypothetical protein